MLATGNNYIRYNLSIRISADGFSFFVTEAASGDLMHCEDHQRADGMSMAQTLSEMLRRPSIQRNTYDVVQVILDSDSTCIPIDELSRNELDTLYVQVFDDADLVSSQVCYTLLPQLDVAEVYTVPRALLEAVHHVYPEAVFINSYALVLGKVTQFCKRRDPERQPLFAYILSDQLFVFSIFRDKLLFANSFSLDEKSNALYFLLSVWKELGLNAHQNICFLSGEQDCVQPLAEQLRSYLLHIEMMENISLYHVN